jgi:FMN phosphatase YigB (HAD superfamily)
MQRAALFDAGDTLLHWNVHKRDRFRWMCEQVGATLPLDEIACRNAARAAERFFYSHSGRTDSWTESWWIEVYAAGVAELGLPLDIAVRMATFRRTAPNRWVLDPVALLVLQQLRERDYKIGLVSNWDGTLATTCGELGLASHIDYIGDSTVFGQAKPAASFFLHVLDRLGAHPENAFHVGDHYDADVVGARAAGISAVLIDVLGHEERACDYRAMDLCDVLSFSRRLMP